MPWFEALTGEEFLVANFTVTDGLTRILLFEIRLTHCFSSGPLVFEVVLCQRMSLSIFPASCLSSTPRAFIIHQLLPSGLIREFFTQQICRMRERDKGDRGFGFRPGSIIQIPGVVDCHPPSRLHPAIPSYLLSVPECCHLMPVAVCLVSKFSPSLYFLFSPPPLRHPPTRSLSPLVPSLVLSSLFPLFSSPHPSFLLRRSFLSSPQFPRKNPSLFSFSFLNDTSQMTE